MRELPFRATVILRQDGRGEPFALMERYFAAQGDAVKWCEIMTTAQSRASGSWFVAQARPGRILAVCQSSGVALSLEEKPRTAGTIAAGIPDLTDAEVASLLGHAAASNSPVRLRPPQPLAKSA